MNYFENEKTLLKLLNEYRDCFERIQYYGQLFKDKVIVSLPHDIAMAMSELSGIFASLNEIAYQAETEQLNLEEVVAEKRRIDRENKKLSIGSKSNFDKDVEKIGLYRRIRNQFKEKKETCDKLITVCQSLLRVAEKEQRTAGNV